MSKRLINQVPKPPNGWWNKFDPVHVSAPLVVAAVCWGGKPDWLTALFGLATIGLLMGYSWLNRKV
jgi:hypothetical protein